MSGVNISSMCITSDIAIAE